MTIQERIANAEAALKEQFARIDAIEEHGTRRILKAYQEHILLRPPVTAMTTSAVIPWRRYLPIFSVRRPRLSVRKSSAVPTLSACASSV